MTFFGTGSAKMLPFLSVAALACGSVVVVVVDAFVVKRVRTGSMPFATTSSGRTSLGLLDVRGRRSGNGGGGGGQHGEHQDRQGGLNFDSYSSFYNKHNRDPDGVASILSQHEPSTNIWGRYEQQQHQHEQDFERHQQEQHSRNLLYTESGNRRGENNRRGGYNGGGEVYSNKGRDFYNTAANQERRHDRQRMTMGDMDAGRRNGPRVPRLLATHGSSRPENQFDRNGASSNDGGFGGGGPNGSDFAFSDTNRNGRSVASIIANQVQGAVRQPPHLRVAQQYQQSQNQHEGMTNNRNDGITSQGQFTENFAHSDRHRNGFGVGSTVSNAMQRGGGPGGPRDQQLQQQQQRAMEQDQQRRQQQQQFQGGGPLPPPHLQQQQQQHPQDRQGRQQERRPRMPGSPQPQSPREQEHQQRQERNAFERMVMQQQDQEQQMMQQQQRRQQQSGYNDVDYAPPLQPEHARRLEQQFQQQQQRRQDADREHQNQQQQQQQQQHLGEPWEQTRGGRFQGGMMMNPQQQQQQQRQRQEQQEQQRRMSGPPGGEPWEQTRGGERGGVGQQGRSGDRRVHQGYNDMDGVGRIASPYLETGRSSRAGASGGGVGSVGGVGNFMGVRPPSQREQQQRHPGGGRRLDGPNDPDTRGTARGMNTAQPRGGGFGGAGRQQQEERRHRGGYDNLDGERYGSPGSVGNFVQSSMAAGSPREQQQQQQQQREQQQQQRQQEQQQRQQPNRGGGRSAATPLGPNDSDTRGTTFGLNTAPPQGQKQRFQYNIHHDPRGPGHPGQQRFGPNSGGGPAPPLPNGMPPPMPPMGGTMMIPPLPPPPQFRP